MSIRHIFSLFGIVGGLFWITLAFFPPECAPVTEASEVMCNRLWSPALLGMGLGFVRLFLSLRTVLPRIATTGWVVLLASFALMFLGNVVEYWLFSDWPHQGPDGFIRGLAWMTVLLGFLVAQIASAVVGFYGFKSGDLPKLTSAPFLLLLPATLVTGFISLPGAGIPLGIVSMAAGLSGLLRTNSRTARASHPE